MPKAKSFLKSLYRTEPHKFSRVGYLRLDMNEGIPGLPDDFVKKVLREINPKLLSAYPEDSIIRKKIAIHDKLKPENICLANGSVSAIKYIFDAYISEGDKVLLTKPTFAMYPVYCIMFGAKTLTVEYNADLLFPLGNFMKHISRNIKLAIIVNPNNPTGSVIEENDLARIIKKAATCDVIVIVDEAYFFFYPSTAIKLVKKYKNLIILRTFSKLCGLAGLRLGYATSSSEIIANLNKVKTPYEVNSLAVLFASKLLDNPGIIRELILQTNEGKKYLIKKLSEAHIEYRTGQANFILIKCNGRVKQIMSLLNDKKILVAGGFPQDFLKDYIRVTYGEKKMMEEFWVNFIEIFRSN